ARFPKAEIIRLPVGKLESASALQRLRFLRSLKPELFAISTEAVDWQQGQNALLIFGALGGADRVIIFDARGHSREETRAHLLSRAPFRLAREKALSRVAIRQAESDLTRLESAIKTSPDFRVQQKSATLQVTYLRTTPAAGTQSGGATTHTTGFINAAAEL